MRGEGIEIGSINKYIHAILCKVPDEDEPSAYRPIRYVLDISPSFPFWSLIGFESRYKPSPVAVFS